MATLQELIESKVSGAGGSLTEWIASPEGRSELAGRMESGLTKVGAINQIQAEVYSLSEAAAGREYKPLPVYYQKTTAPAPVFVPEQIPEPPADLPKIGGLEVQTMALPAVIPAIGAVGAALGVGAGGLATIAGVGGALYGVAQALGLGEGGGLFGINLLGGDEFTQGGVEFGGPGLAEPAKAYVQKEWHVNYDWGRLQYYLVQAPGQSRKIAMYNTRTKKWKVWVWRQPRLAVIGKNMPSHKMIVRLRRNLKKHTADAKSILKLTSPSYGARQGGYGKRKRR